MITACPITDQQIRELRQQSATWLDDNGAREGTDYAEYFQHTFTLIQCDVALGRRRARKGSSRAKARVRCAEILNARATETK